MQAIITKYLPATNNRGSRIKASCDRGTITISYPHELSGDEVHREAVRALVSKFNAEDRKEYGPDSCPSGKGWNAPFASGSIPSGEMVHVFVI